MQGFTTNGATSGVAYYAVIMGELPKDRFPCLMDAAGKLRRRLASRWAMRSARRVLPTPHPGDGQVKEQGLTLGG